MFHVLKLGPVQLSQHTTNVYLRVTAGGNEVSAGESGRGVVIRNLRIAGGSVRWAAPYEPDSASLAAA